MREGYGRAGQGDLRGGHRGWSESRTTPDRGPEGLVTYPSHRQRYLIRNTFIGPKRSPRRSLGNRDAPQAVEGQNRLVSCRVSQSLPPAVALPRQNLSGAPVAWLTQPSGLFRNSPYCCKKQHSCHHLRLLSGGAAAPPLLVVRPGQGPLRRRTRRGLCASARSGVEVRVGSSRSAC